MGNLMDLKLVGNLAQYQDEVMAASLADCLGYLLAALLA